MKKRVRSIFSIHFSEGVPKIGGESTGIMGKPETIPDFKAPTGIIGDFGDFTNEFAIPLSVAAPTDILGKIYSGKLILPYAGNIDTYNTLRYKLTFSKSH